MSNNLSATEPRALRVYQQRIVEAVGSSNAIVKMPTGSGKTIVAAELLRRRHENAKSPGPPNQKTLFLVPTCELVEQQARVVESWTAHTIAVARFTGGMSDPVLAAFEVLVATPQAFLGLKQRCHWSWDLFHMVIYDEVHHVLKDHPYRKIALDLLVLRNEHSTEEAPQMLGLSASLTYGVIEEEIRKTLLKLCRELGIVKMMTPNEQELIEGGYIPQKRDDNIEVEISSEVPEGVPSAIER